MNSLYYGDNLEVLRKKINDETVDLCDIDSPFNSKRNYKQKGLRKKRPSSSALSYSNGWSKPLFSFCEDLRCFALDMTATQTAQMTGISLRSTNQIFLRLREKFFQECEKNSPFAGGLEADESYFGPRRVRGKRGRGAAGKTIVFGLLKRDATGHYSWQSQSGIGGAH